MFGENIKTLNFAPKFTTIAGSTDETSVWIKQNDVYVRSDETFPGLFSTASLVVTVNDVATPIDWHYYQFYLRVQNLDCINIDWMTLEQLFVPKEVTNFRHIMVPFKVFNQKICGLSQSTAVASVNVDTNSGVVKAFQNLE